ncbi:tyrosine-type recombinase/integrase [Jeotgalibaca caeni]|uniref:tyrosine-type recombinase/integrase n=1 Tax=Jeotgalibaca caeni TaxID=3028623 RepID=UPI00237D7262|nr:site-specific integrase [Jeotgalibaca caeni]MDE1549477.1 site-specific integrase [Jeotgalibaca caeni]
MVKFERYTKKDGTKAWLFKGYIATDPFTGKKKHATRQGFRTKPEANNAYLKLQRQILKGENLNRTQKSFEEIGNMWLEQYVNTVRESTYRKTKEILEVHVYPVVGKKRINAISLTMCQTMVNNWAKKYVKFSTYASYTSKVFKFAMKHDFIDKNPMELVTMPRKERKKEDKNFYTVEDLKVFFECLEKENDLKKHAFFRLLAFTGMRRQEILALTWKDINLEDYMVSVNKGLTEDIDRNVIVGLTKNQSSNRLIGIDETTRDILSEWKDLQHQENVIANRVLKDHIQFVFNNKDNSHYHTGSASRWLKELVQKYDLKPITLHQFRHTHASLLYESGMDIKNIQNRLGHSTIVTTLNTYTHLNKKASNDVGVSFKNYVGF